jgi:glycosyltransferase involved in cell wall biosynthesis
MSDRLPFVSFIIPALNEEKNIIDTIDSIKATMQSRAYEIIVADNGSSDRTRSLAESAGAKVLKNPEATIASLRNIGTAAAEGEVLAFLDADVTLASDWCQNLITDYQHWPDDHLIITGSRCRTPESGSFVEKNWFDHLCKTRSNYINSGHLVTTKTMHRTINGFDDDLKTSEDHDYCLRASRKNAKITPNFNLKAYHHGYPPTILKFIIREAWHGKEDMSSFEKFFNSRTALLATSNALLIASFPVFYILSNNPVIAFIPLIISAFLCLAITFMKFGSQEKIQWLKTAFCFELYLLGRAASVLFTKARPTDRS